MALESQLPIELDRSLVAVGRAHCPAVRLSVVKGFQPQFEQSSGGKPAQEGLFAVRVTSCEQTIKVVCPDRLEAQVDETDGVPPRRPRCADLLSRGVVAFELEVDFGE